MVSAPIIDLLTTGSSKAVEDLLDDQENIVLVDWREEDDAIVRDCEAVLQTGDLAVEVVDIDNEPHFEMYISHRGQRVKVPLVVGIEDRHITIHTLNQLLQPAYEIRVCVDSHGSDTLAFLPLPASDWASLEARFGQQVDQHFRKIEEHPNLFTERWSAKRPRDNQPLQRIGAAGILSKVRTWFGRGPGH